MAKPESHAGLKTPLLPPRPPTPPIPKGPTPPAKPVFTLPTATDLAARKKGLGARSWLRLDSQGNSQLLEADKYAIMRRCGIPARDLRILDPLLAYPSTILGREKAIVVNLEAIKAIITADEVLLLNPMDAAVLTYTEELQRRLQPPLAGPAHGGQPWLDAPPAAEGAPLGGGAARMGHVRSRSETDLGSIFSGESGGVRDNNERGQPFEFRALEMALEMACSQLHHQSEALEQEAFPALDELTSKISTLNLERVRRLKSRLMALTVRVQKMRDEVEQLLDDDDDMAEMYLSEKRQKLEPAPESPLSTYSGVTARTPRTPFGSAFTRNTLAEGSEADDGDSPPHLLRRDSRASRYSSSTESDDVDVEELEMLLEAYFVQIDGITNKLNALKNYIDDTEDYINLQLDNHRNQLLQLEIVLTIATFVMAMFSVVAGVFGMNIPISIFHEDHAWLFKWVLLGSGAGGMAVFAGLISWIKYNNLIN